MLLLPDTGTSGEQALAGAVGDEQAATRRAAVDTRSVIERRIDIVLASRG